MKKLRNLICSIFSAAALALPLTYIETGEIAKRMSSGSAAEKLSAYFPVFGAKMFPSVMIFFVLCLLIFRRAELTESGEKFSLSALLLSALFSAQMLVGEADTRYESLDVLFRNGPQLIQTGIKWVGYLLLLYTLIRMGYSALERKAASAPGPDSLFEKHPFLFPFCVILIARLPFVTAFCPGFVPSDGLKQLNNFFGSGNFTNNHPAFSSMLMGWAMTLGRKLGSDDLGIFLFTGPQLLITAAVMAYSFTVMKSLGTSRLLRLMILFDYALLPVWANYSYSLLKDGLYITMLLFLVLQCIRMLTEREGFFSRKINIVLSAAAMCLMTLMRHEGVAVCLLTGAALLFVLPSRRRTLLLMLLVLVLVRVGFNDILLPALNIPDAPLREGLTMEIRQTAKTVSDHREDISDSEWEELGKVFDRMELFEERYSASNGDGVKDLFDPYADPQTVLGYLKTWAKMGLKYPLSYLEVLLCANSRYTYPFTGVYRDIYGWFGIESESYVNKGLFDIHYIPQTESLRRVLINLADAMPLLPFTSLFYSLGLNGWVLLFCLAFLLRKRIRGNIIPLIGPLFHYIMCMNTALNGFLRYMLPVMICLPVCMIWVSRPANQSDTPQTGV